MHVNGTAGNPTGVWSTVSDRKLKRDIQPLRGALETLSKLQGVSFHWKDPQEDAKYGLVRGFVAQDVEKVLPEWVKEGQDGTKWLEKVGVEALLVEAIKELKAENDDLRRRMEALAKH